MKKKFDVDFFKDAAWAFLLSMVIVALFTLIIYLAFGSK